MAPPRRLVLASASPRRRALLEEAGLRFEVVPSGAEESIPPGLPPERCTEEIALRKARAAAASLGDALVLAADTLVAVGGRILGKPRDREEARAFLSLLSGSAHRVVTGVALGPAPAGPWRVAHASTEIRMRKIAPREIEAYVASGEWEGKAGAYAIQETGESFVTGIEGSRTNVVGLPMELVLDLLRSGGAGGERSPGD